MIRRYLAQLGRSPRRVCGVETAVLTPLMRYSAHFCFDYEPRVPVRYIRAGAETECLGIAKKLGRFYPHVPLFYDSEEYSASCLEGLSRLALASYCDVSGADAKGDGSVLARAALFQSMIIAGCRGESGLRRHLKFLARLEADPAGDTGGLIYKAARQMAQVARLAPRETTLVELRDRILSLSADPPHLREQELPPVTQLAALIAAEVRGLCEEC